MVLFHSVQVAVEALLLLLPALLVVDHGHFQ